MNSTAETKSFLEEVCEVPGGEGVRLCIQCGTCTASCPNAERMDHTPSMIIAMTRANMREEVLSSNAMWFCVSCYMCTVRCPRGIKSTDIMHALEGMAVKSGLNNKHITTPTMYKAFNQIVADRGKLPEFWLMLSYYMRTNPFRALGMTQVALELLKHGRITIKTAGISPEGRKQLKAIIDKSESSGGAL